MPVRPILLRLSLLLALALVALVWWTGGDRGREPVEGVPRVVVEPPDAVLPSPTDALRPEPSEVANASETGALEPEAALSRFARVAGRVVHPNGLPSPGARVRARVASVDDPSRAVAFDGTADDEGRFELRELAAGRIALEATSPGSASSVPLELDVRAGDELTGVLLALRSPARILGRALDERGEPDVGRSIALTKAGNRGVPRRDTLLTDASGGFDFAGLDPGEYALERVVRTEELAGGASGPEGELALARLRTETRVELGEGETLELVLGGPAPAEVRVWGFVLGAEGFDEPLLVCADAHGAPASSPARRVPVDERGSYELLLEAGGAHTLRVDASGGTLCARQVSLPASGSERVDLELGSAAVSGRVIDAAGAPISGAELLLAPAPRAEGGPLGPFRPRRAESGADGSFAFEHVETGTYSLQARATSHALAAARIEELAATPGARIEGLELRLDPSGSIEVLALGPDGPLARVQVRALDTSGRAPEARPARMTDEHGVTRIEGLPPGKWLVHAAHERFASRWSEPIEIGAGGSAHARIELSAGAMVQVDLSGALAPGAWISVRDERGLELARAWAAVRGTAASATVSLGPLPYGQFELRAEDASGRAASIPLTVDGPAPGPVALELAE